MEHLKLLVLLAAVVAAAVAASLVMAASRRYGNRAGPWFALSLAGLGLVALEILIYRYANLTQGILSPGEAAALRLCWMSVSLGGGLCLTLGLPRSAHRLAGLGPARSWRAWFGYLPVTLTALGGFGYMMPPHERWMVWLVQLVVFGSVAYSGVVLAVVRPGWQDRRRRTSLGSLMAWSLVCLPLMVLDATTTGFLPPWLDNLAVAWFILGACLIGALTAPGLFGQVPFFREGQLTSRFVEGFGLSKREAELVPLVLDGLPNAAIGERLFISEKTVENHLTNILRKTGTKNRLQLFRLVMSQAV